MVKISVRKLLAALHPGFTPPTVLMGVVHKCSEIRCSQVNNPDGARLDHLEQVSDSVASAGKLSGVSVSGRSLSKSSGSSGGRAECWSGLVVTVRDLEVVIALYDGSKWSDFKFPTKQILKEEKTQEPQRQWRLTMGDWLSLSPIVFTTVIYLPMSTSANNVGRSSEKRF